MMEIFSSPIQVLLSLIIFIAGLFISIKIGKIFKCSPKRGILIYFWHSFFCMIYLWYVLNHGGDALSYYRSAVIGGVEFKVGTSAVKYFTSILVQVFDLSLIGCFLLFNIFGVVGLLSFDGSLRIATADKVYKIRRLASIITFLPSISFWSSALGKDAIAFMATGLALWSALNLARRTILMGFSVALMFIVRPHIAGIMIIAITLASAFDKKSSFTKKIILLLITSLVTASLVPFALQYAGVDEAVDTESLTTYVENRQGYNTSGGGGVDIASMSLPMQLFTFMFRPLIVDANSIFALAASLDNLIILYLFAFGLYAIMRKKIMHGFENRIFMWTYSLLTWIVLSMTTANLGIAMRQKWMLAPMLIFLLISVIGRKYTSSIGNGRI